MLFALPANYILSLDYTLNFSVLEEGKQKTLVYFALVYLFFLMKRLRKKIRRPSTVLLQITSFFQ